MTQLHSLSKRPKEIDGSLVKQARAHIVEGSNLLSELSKHCCIPERSETMNGSREAIATLAETLQIDPIDRAELVTAIDRIGDLGANIGKLYATCCTPVRKPLYERFYGTLHKAHLSLNGALGIGH